MLPFLGVCFVGAIGIQFVLFSLPPITWPVPRFSKKPKSTKTHFLAVEKKNPPIMEKLRYWDFTVPIVGRYLSSKFQAPSSRETSSTKLQGTHGALLCCLMLGASLVLGAWCLELFAGSAGDLFG